MPAWANRAFFVCTPLVSVALCRKRLFSICGKLQHESPAEISITSPSSFVPFGHQLFISLVVFRFVYGYSLTFGEANRVPVAAFSALVALCLVAFHVVARRRALSPDGLFRVSLLFSVAGFLALSVGSASRDAVASALLTAGTGAFEILMYYVLIQVGSRNPVGALSAFAWGNAMASWGTIFGALFGRMTNVACQNDGCCFPPLRRAPCLLLWCTCCCCLMAAIIAPSYFQTPCSGGFFIFRTWKPPAPMAPDPTESLPIPWANRGNAPDRVVFFSPYGPFMEKSAFVCRKSRNPRVETPPQWA